MRVGPHRTCLFCDSRKLARLKGGRVVHEYHCRECRGVFRGSTLLMLRVSWPGSPKELGVQGLSGGSSKSAASALFWLAITIAAMTGVVIVWLSRT